MGDPVVPEPCEHFYVAGHEPGHLIYWVRICQFCHKPDWDDLDNEVNQLLEGKKMSDQSSTTLPELDSNDFMGRAKQLVYAYVKSRLEKTDTHVTFGPDEVYVVLFAKTLGNWKALLSTTLPYGMYYEVTHDGVLGFDYIDAYKKFENVSVPEGADPAQFL